MTKPNADIHFAPLERQFARLATPFEEFVHRQTTSGFLLILTALLALITANSGLAPFYEHLLHTPLSVSAGTWTLNLSLHHAINDGLMAIFFLLVGLELKRELLHGELANIRRAALPVIAAAGGMLMPAAIYLALAPNGPEANGWAIPMATDIAFAVGVLALLASRVPKSLITFLVALAIADDLGAVLVIAFFYTSTIGVAALVAAAGIVLLMFLLNASGIRRSGFYLLLAIPLWYALLKAGIHPTLAGVLTAFAIPSRRKYNTTYFSAQMGELLSRFNQTSAQNDEDKLLLTHAMQTSLHRVTSPLQRLEQALHIPVAFLVIPVFAYFNAGLHLEGMTASALINSPVLWSTFFGLLLGKFIGILSFSWLAIRLKIAALPEQVNLTQIAGIALLAGIGFTMSIFIAQLAFPHTPELVTQAKLGIFMASLVAGIGGYCWLWAAGEKRS